MNIREDAAEAVQAAHGAICEQNFNDCLEWRGKCVKAVEAAASYIQEAVLDEQDWLNEKLADAWDEGVSDGQWNSEHIYQIDAGSRHAIPNPYRSQT